MKRLDTKTTEEASHCHPLPAKSSAASTASRFSKQKITYRPHICPSTDYDRVSTTSLYFDRLRSCIDHIFVLRQIKIMHRPHLCLSTVYDHASTTSLSFDRLRSCIDHIFVFRQSMIVYRPHLCPSTVYDRVSTTSLSFDSL